MRNIIAVQTRVWNQTIKLMDDFDKWNFDIFKYQDTLGDAALLHFGMKIF